MNKNVSEVFIVILAILFVFFGFLLMGGSWERFFPTNGVAVEEGEPNDVGTRATIQTRIDQGASALGIKVVPLAVLEDSRCPTDVACVWEGRVRLRTLLSSPSGEAPQIFELNQPITTETMEVTLVGVEPLPVSTQEINLNDYRFIFEIKSRTDI